MVWLNSHLYQPAIDHTLDRGRLSLRRIPISIHGAFAMKQPISSAQLRPIHLALAAGLVLLLAGPARAWDAGPEKCKHDPCSGGAGTGVTSFPDTRPHYLKHDCPPGSKRSAISTCVHKVQWRGNTHLFVVRQALALLGRSADADAKKVAALMNQPACQAEWETGLWDADDPNGKLVETYSTARGTHFFNAGGKDFFGKPTKIITYDAVVAGEQHKYGDAKSHAHQHLHLGADEQSTASALASDPTCKTGPGKTAAHELGLALHYLTDMTQPMHSSSYSALQHPLSLHAVWEEYVPTIQANYATKATDKWDGKLKGLAPDAAFEAVAKAANAEAPALAKALKPGGLTICTMTGQLGATYTGYCWAHDKVADDAAGAVLRAAYQQTAGYLVAVLAAKK
jgi:hypothetical protein